MFDETINSDCLQHALTYISKTSEKELESILDEAGVSSKEGLAMKDLPSVLKSLGRVYQKSLTTAKGKNIRQNPTVWQFAQRNADAVYLVVVSGHILVLDRGRVIDPYVSDESGLKRRIVTAYKITNAPKRERGSLLDMPAVVHKMATNTRHVDSHERPRYEEMVEYIKNNPGCTFKDVIENTDYTLANLKWDYPRGHVGALS